MRKIFGILVSVCSLISFSNFAATTADTKTNKIRWVMAHEPVELFRRAADHFAKEVASQSHGKLEVEILTVGEYATRYTTKPSDYHQHDVLKSLQNGEIEMSQTYTTTLGQLNRDMYVLDLPFLFRDHAHAQKVLEGPVGAKLLAGLSKANIRGLAFTYSGGYRVIPAKTAINKVDDFKGMKIRTSGSPVAIDTMTMLGAQPVVMELDDVGAGIKEGSVVGGESTFARFYGSRQNELPLVVNDTHHSLFLTSILINQTFLNKLSPDLQKIIFAAALSAGRLERKESIADVDITKAKCLKDGIRVVTLSKEEQQVFKSRTKAIYKKYDKYFSPSLISDIEVK